MSFFYLIIEYKKGYNRMKLFGKVLILSTVAMGLFASAALAEEVMGRCVAYDKAKNTIAIIKLVSLMMAIVFLALSYATHLPITSSARAADAKRPIATVLKIRTLPNSFIRL